ncbi:glycoside hydrolase family 38 protein [Obba rivulosa]|uniref:Alpha-mannosidase n=1 Tax=Obba rivulosa TaxID=1052685 RepID=A0A8E2AW42_9APHY|nr:glycoside hydrolase family 38 protein [Obba rivulosa]
MCSHHHGSSSVDYPTTNHGPGAKWIKHLTKDRLSTFNGGHFSDVNLASVLFVHRLDDANHVSLQVWSAPGLEKPSFEEAMKQKFRPAKKGESFGPSWVRSDTNHWWKVSVKIPAYWEQYERVQFEFDPGCEAMIYTTDGVPLQGITGGFGGDRRVEYIIPRELVKAGKHEFVIESSCNGMFGVPWNGDTIAPPDMNRFFQLASADLVVPRADAWALLWDFQTLRELVDTLPGNTALQNRALSVANEIMNVFDNTDLASIPRARKLAETVFGEAWESKGEGIYKDGAERPQIWGIGHCHIDTAWLWPYRVTQQKVARSWSTQVDLMERYPEHRFTCSQAQQYKWLEQLYPPLFERVKAKILKGQFHPVGGSWVENDSNMPSGEALARQFIFGQRYFESRFGKRCETAWLPDSFGLTGALPQLIRLADMKYFFTQKLSWNNINVFPHSTFNWVGIDGTQVLCHMTPVDTYTAQATVGDVNKGTTNHKNLESSDISLLVFGNGDGGGGPLAKMLENLRRIRAVSNNSRELPPVSMGQSVEDFFDTITKESEAGKKLPNWSGELYLEFHRGTYTSHGSIKKGNRKSEILLRDVEHLATLASLYKFHSGDYNYPNDTINDCWEKVLLNQFHDVLPGSAIGMVYADAEKLYAEVRKDAEELIEEAYSALLPKSVRASTKVPIVTSDFRLVGYNTTPFPRRDVVEFPAHNGTVHMVLECPEGSNVSLPSTTLTEDLDRGAFASINEAGDLVFQSPVVRMTISEGRISSLVDLELDRELIPAGQTGGLVIFDDRPNYWDAWDVEVHHLETPHPLHFTNYSVKSNGCVATVLAEVKYGQSTIKVKISLDSIAATLKKDSRPLIRFDATVDWHERHKFLKFEIPLNIHNDVATYETQFGHVQRPTHKNTTWDMAKFEVCGHKYADLSEFGYGVALLSESKYGFSCRGNVLRISLLRAATAPDAEQDQGMHEFSWAIKPHKGHFLESDVPQAAYIFNSPLHLRYVGEDDHAPLLETKTPFSVEGASNVFLETVKRGLDDDFDSHENSAYVSVVLRLYEAFGGHAQAKLNIGGHIPFRKVLLTNLLEDEIEELDVHKDESSSFVKLKLHGFEVKTVKIIVGRAFSSDAESEGASSRRSSWVTVEKP